MLNKKHAVYLRVFDLVGFSTDVVGVVGIEPTTNRLCVPLQL